MTLWSLPEALQVARMLGLEVRQGLLALLLRRSQEVQAVEAGGSGGLVERQQMPQHKVVVRMRRVTYQRRWSV